MYYWDLGNLPNLSDDGVSILKPEDSSFSFEEIVKDGSFSFEKIVEEARIKAEKKKYDKQIFMAAIAGYVRLWFRLCVERALLYGVD